MVNRSVVPSTFDGIQSGSPNPDEPKVRPAHNIYPHINYEKRFFFASFVSAVLFLSTVTLAIIAFKLYTDQGNEINPSPNDQHISLQLNSFSERFNKSGSYYAKYKRAAITTENGFCSEIGRDILVDGGNAVDAAIASLICLGVINPQFSGLGGGFFMTIYNATSSRCYAVNAREAAPLSFNISNLSGQENWTASYESIAIPSEIHGFWTAFKRFGSGRVTWERLFRPSIDLAIQGFPVSTNLAVILAENEEQILTIPALKRMFVDSVTGRVYEEGDIMKREHLGFTLRLISNSSDPVDLFYIGGLAQTISAEINENGGQITLDDLAAYSAEVVENTVESNTLAGDLVMCGPPPPSSSIIAQNIVSILTELQGDHKEMNLDDAQFYHSLIEAEKFAYSQRSKLGDVDFVRAVQIVAQNMTKKAYVRWIKSLITQQSQPPENYFFNGEIQTNDHGTSQITVIDSLNNGVSCTSTINQIFGSMHISTTLGIIWNDSMGDFAIPSDEHPASTNLSRANEVAPGKRPVSSMSPMIIFNKNTGKVRLVIGASGGSAIMSAIAQVIVRVINFNQTVKEAIDSPRMHNQFVPYVTQYEKEFPQILIDSLINQYGQNMTSVKRQRSIVQALELKDDGYIYGNSDYRRMIATYPAGY